jgi:hypothetical protein
VETFGDQISIEIFLTSGMALMFQNIIHGQSSSLGNYAKMILRRFFLSLNLSSCHQRSQLNQTQLHLLHNLITKTEVAPVTVAPKNQFKTEKTRKSQAALAAAQSPPSQTMKK